MDPEAHFAQLLEQYGNQRRPPVDQWQPAQSGQIDIRIDREGHWYHEGEMIQRQPLVQLFASILRHDADGYVLVTPAERLLIEVEDVPFVAIDCDVRSGLTVDSPVSPGSASARMDLLFTTNVGDLVLADDAHRIWLSDGVEQVPYITVRPGLDARITRSVYYRLLDHVQIVDQLATLSSAGAVFPLGPVR